MNKIPWPAALFFAALPLVLFAQSFSPQSESAPAAGDVADTPPPVNTTIPPELWRPARGEAPRYPVDTVIGQIGRGDAPESAYQFARLAADALMMERSNDPALQGVDAALTDSLFAGVKAVSPEAFRLGGGRTEPDGAVSFLVRFLGAEQGVTGELFLRGDGWPAAAPADGEGGRLNPAAETADVDNGDGAQDSPAQAAPAAEAAATAEAAPAAEAAVDNVVWYFEDLILDDPAARPALEQEQKFDFSPYHRFF